MAVYLAAPAYEGNSGGYLYNRHLTVLEYREIQQFDHGNKQPKQYRKNAQDFLDEIKGEAVILDSLYLYSDETFVRAVKNNAASIGWMIHSFSDPEPGAKELAELKSADYILCTSQFMSQMLKDLMPDKSIFSVLPGNIILVERNPQNEKLNILTLGPICSNKNQQFIYEILKDLKGWEWHIAGAYEEAPYYAMDPRVHLYGAQELSSLEKLYQRSDLYISASRTETFGMAVFDARNSGIPVLAYRTGGIEEAIFPAIHSKTFPHFELEIWKEAVDEFIQNPGRKEKPRKRSWETVNSELNSCLRKIPVKSNKKIGAADAHI
jgi:glycosyltransferase involved in cell wall biosynthesis